MKRSIPAIILMVFFISSCALFKKSGPSPDEFANYTEDISSDRITFPDLSEEAKKVAETAPKSSAISVDNDLEYALKAIKDNNKGERYWNGFTVLVYSGVDREQAFKAREELTEEFPDIKSEMQYQQPRYLLKVGKFVNRVEAQAHYHKLKSKFPTVRIIQDRFQREGYVNPDPVEDVERPDQNISEDI
ncbi:hypothetical protein A33Q_2586 [Indibacter alkaliphilus LW1]|uniref:SPOR domain-containing protein n=1 Tax=Indibacter alkaliphilus (strain CCUG 57479 / KCTC 22604 / LW1) TaxID=1189612 RepID=S2E1P3_INDAL|nr:SPOR domain-containing protein [Indibacter alkaliphilus]EOZ95993.1 hypothetical protein A33Q_2586 [Indibacter alkaliphilus LW1]